LSADRYRQDLDRSGQFFTRLTQAILARDSDKAAELITNFANHQKALIQQALAVS